MWVADLDLEEFFDAVNQSKTVEILPRTTKDRRVMMNRKELVIAISDEAGISIKDADSALAAVMGAISGALEAGDDVGITGFGTFLRRERSARAGVNPQTGSAIEIPATLVPVFRAGKTLKEAVRG